MIQARHRRMQSNAHHGDHCQFGPKSEGSSQLKGARLVTRIWPHVSRVGRLRAVQDGQIPSETEHTEPLPEGQQPV